MWKRIKRLRIKLSTLTLFITAVALVGLAVLAVMYIQERREQGALASEIEAARQSLAEYGDAAGSQGRLAIAEAELAVEQAAFPSLLSGAGIVGALMHLAEENGLRVADIKTQPGTEKEVGEHTYRAMSVNVQVEGTLRALRTFVGDVESGSLQAVRVDELSITGIERPSTASWRVSVNGPDSDEAGYSVTASLAFSVYSRTKSP